MKRRDTVTELRAALRLAIAAVREGEGVFPSWWLGHLDAVSPEAQATLERFEQEHRAEEEAAIETMHAEEAMLAESMRGLRPITEQEAAQVELERIQRHDPRRWMYPGYFVQGRK